MRPSEALAAHRAELRELVSRYDVKNPRIFGSVLTGTDDEESDLFFHIWITIIIVDTMAPNP